MRRILALLGLTLAIAAVSGALFESHPTWKYRFLAAKYPWIGEQIYQRPFDKPINLFLGTSRIGFGVDTDLINNVRPHQTALNFGVNWFGNDNKRVILRDFLLRHRPARIFIEIRMTDDRSAHAVYPCLATIEDLLAGIPRSWRTLHSYQKINWRDTISQLASLFECYAVKGIYFQLRAIAGNPPAEAPNFSSSGHYRLAPKTARPGEIVEISQFDDSAQWTELSKTFQDMIGMAEVRKIPLYFVFMPARNDPMPGDRFQAELNRHGRVLWPDLQQLYRPGYWRDDSHLNTAGSEFLTRYLLSAAALD